MSNSSLFRIIVLHGAPKDSHTSTETYLVAEDEAAVFDWINKEKNYGFWAAKDEEDGDYENGATFREWVMFNRGDLEDEEGWEDAYYGVTKWGWEPVEANPEDIATLLRLGIAKGASQKPSSVPFGSACSHCDGTGGVDSGGFTPWGASIDIPCPHCSSPNAKVADNLQ